MEAQHSNPNPNPNPNWAQGCPMEAQHSISETKRGKQTYLRLV